MEQLSLSLIAKHAIVAVFGGVAHAINKQRNGQTKGVMDFILLVVLSSFFGVIFGLLAVNFYPSNEYLTLAVAGAGGWLGIESTGILIDTIRKILFPNK